VTVTDSALKELLDLAHRVAAGDAQAAELLQRAVSRAHSLEASLAKADASNDRLRRMVGTLTEEVALLRDELDAVRGES
jgi:cell division protein FtsB